MPDTDATHEIDSWLRHNAHRLNTLDPDATDDTDLAPLGELIGDARVVMIGESMHRIHEFYQFRHRVFRYLAREHGFTALVMESGFPEGLAVDEWIRGGADRVRWVLEKGLTYHMGKCQEMLDQLAWMREHNAQSPRPVRFYGMDLPASSATDCPASWPACPCWTRRTRITPKWCAATCSRSSTTSRRIDAASPGRRRPSSLTLRWRRRPGSN